MQDPRDDEFRTIAEPIGDGAERASRDGSDPTTELEAAELAPGAVRRERLLTVSTDEAWELLRDAEGLSQWLADDVDVEVAPGERGTLVDDGETCEIAVDEVEDGRRVALRWWSAEGEESLVDLVLDDVDGRTRLTVTELPLQVVSVPDMVPESWTIDGGSGGLGGAAGPQLLALACH